MRLRPLILLLAAVMLAGCQQRPPDFVVPTGDFARWPYWPTAMRLHPLTRVVRDEDQPLIEARVEFSDRDGVTSRACGSMVLELLAPGLAGRAGTPLQRWEVDLRSLRLNANHFDVVTRTYLFKLAVEPDVEIDGATLRATYEGAEERRLADEREM